MTQAGTSKPLTATRLLTVGVIAVVAFLSGIIGGIMLVSGNWFDGISDLAMCMLLVMLTWVICARSRQ